MPRRQGEAPLPAIPHTHTRVFNRFSGFDARGGVRAGTLSACKNIDPRQFPYLTTTASPRKVVEGLPGNMLSLHAVGDAIYVVYEKNEQVYLFRRRPDGSESRAPLTKKDLTSPRIILPYNLYSNPQDPLQGSYRHRAVVYPDGLWFDPEADIMVFTSIAGEGGAPVLSQACVHLSRVFGANGDRLYACAYNDPSDWNIDTAGDIHAANAWTSTVQSNTHSSGDFTALCVYSGHVLAFKKQFCHILHNNKNPFRVADLLSVGTPDGRTVAEVEGRLFFVAEDGVYRYNGDTATRISDPLGNPSYEGALAAAADGIYYLYLPSTGYVYMYAEQTGAWSCVSPFFFTQLAGMTSDGRRCWFLDDAGTLYATGQQGYSSYLATISPVLDEGIGRACRLSLVVSGEVTASIQVTYTDSKHRQTLLLHRAGIGSIKRLESRVFTPADYGGTLTLSGNGQITLQDIRLTIRE